jgi:hypothetical protein
MEREYHRVKNGILVKSIVYSRDVLLAYIRYACNLLRAMLCEVRLAILSWAVNSYDTMNLDLQRGLHQGKHLDAPRSS